MSAPVQDQSIQPVGSAARNTTSRLHLATTSSDVVDRAACQFAASTDLTVAESLRLVRFTARVAGISAVDVANAMLAGALSIDDLLWPQPSP